MGRACVATLAARGGGVGVAQHAVGPALQRDGARRWRLQRLRRRVVRRARPQRGQLAHPRGQPPGHPEQVRPGAGGHRAHVHLRHLLLLFWNEGCCNFIGTVDGRGRMRGFCFDPRPRHLTWRRNMRAGHTGEAFVLVGEAITDTGLGI